jgi:hypothetical protein
MDFEARYVPGYEGLYIVTTDGKVRRTAASGRCTKAYPAGSELRQTPNTKGYLRVGLRKNGRTVVRPVHQLVLEAFHGPRPEGMVSRHLNGDNTDNRSENLAWGTQAENVDDTLTHGRHPHARKTHCPANHEYDEANTRWVAVRGVPRKSRQCRACDRIKKAGK